MANIKITDLTVYTDPATTDVVPIVDVGNDTTKKVSVGEVVGKITGDVDVATDGTSSIAAGVIVDADVNASAAIAGTKIEAATTSNAGAVQLEDSTASTSTTTAATPNAVKSAYDLADAALPKSGGTMTGDIVFSGTQTFPGGGSGTVTSIDVSGGTGLTSSGGPVTSSGTITVNLDDTAVTPGSYTYASLTVDQQGRITAASSGTAPLTSGDIGSTVQGYDADTAKYDDTTANFTGTLQQGGSDVVLDSDIGVTVQGYDADTAKYDDTTANFTGTLQNGGSNVLVDTDINSTVQGYDADTAKTDTVQSFTAAQRGTITALVDGATITPDFDDGNNFSVTLGGNRTLANPSNITAGQSGVIVVTQDGTGSRTLAYGSYWKFAGGTVPTLTTTASAVDVIAYYVESATRITAQAILNVS